MATFASFVKIALSMFYEARIANYELQIYAQLQNNHQQVTMSCELFIKHFLTR